MKKYRLKRKYRIALEVILIALGILISINIIVKLNNNRNKWYEVCDSHYGYTTDYYTCRQYHINK